MRQFVTGFALALFLLVSASVFANAPEGIEFHLRPKYAVEGLGQFLEFHIQGDHKVELKAKTFRGDSVVAEYNGFEDRTNIINFKVEKKKIIRFQLYTKSAGKYKTPPVEILIDGESVVYPVEEFEVTKHNSNNIPSMPGSGIARGGSIWDRFFGDTRSGKKKVQVEFHTTKKEMFVGDSIIGYFTLYYQNLPHPSIERDPNSTLSFPFFLAETITGVTLSLPTEVVKDDGIYSTLGYNREIFSLMALKPGRYELGSGKFYVGTFPQLSLGAPTIPSSTETVTVYPLPPGAPQSFQGEIGDYKFTVKTNKSQLPLGDSLKVTVKISGRGLLKQTKDPLSNLNFPSGVSLNLIGVEKKSNFQEFATNDPGFFSELEYEYRLTADKEMFIPAIFGEWSFFHPQLAEYQKVSFQIPPTVVTAPPKNPETDTDEVSSPGVFWGWVLLFSGLAFGVVVAFFGAKAVYTNRSTKFGVPRSVLVEWDEWAGNKPANLLKFHLISKGLPEPLAKSISLWRRDYPDQGFAELFTKLSVREKERLEATIQDYIEFKRSHNT